METPCGYPKTSLGTISRTPAGRFAGTKLSSLAIGRAENVGGVPEITRNVIDPGSAPDAPCLIRIFVITPRVDTDDEFVEPVGGAVFTTMTPTARSPAGVPDSSLPTVSAAPAQPAAPNT